MPDMLNADLHCHSTFSDGTLSPEALAQRARERGVQLWALTDHDEVSGLDRASAAAAQQGLAFLSGVEVSVSFGETTVHIVGLGFDWHHAGLREGLARTRGGREQRAREMAAGLEKVGIGGAYEGALRYVGNPDLISRTHFARFLVETRVCRDPAEVFRHYLVEGKPGFVPHRWARLQEAVQWIVQAGGLAVIAHPARYHLNGGEEHALFSSFKDYGGQGVEVVTGSHFPHEYAIYADLANSFGFYASRGCDFHSPGESGTDFGALPPLPHGVAPVWQALEGRILHPTNPSPPPQAAVH
ncbi:MAG: PHP domain-containing protein [Comamonas sp.]|nr:PHP domain-containing protein [Comamonas sp.]